MPAPKAGLLRLKRKPNPNPNPPGQKGTIFRRFFRHWRSGKLMDAWAYGYKGWPIGG